MKRYWHLFLAPAALLFQALPPTFIYYISNASFGKTPSLAETSIWPVSIAGLALLVVTGIVLGCAATYFLLTHSRRLVAAPMIVVFCVPALLLATAYLHSLLVFLTWV
jgi:hypothetical protein